MTKDEASPVDKSVEPVESNVDFVQDALDKLGGSQMQYAQCAECKGWDRHYIGVETVRNHRRGCSHRPNPDELDELADWQRKVADALGYSEGPGYPWYCAPADYVAEGCRKLVQDVRDADEVRFELQELRSEYETVCDLLRRAVEVQAELSEELTALRDKENGASLIEIERKRQIEVGPKPCAICQALVYPSHMDAHLEWHRRIEVTPDAPPATNGASTRMTGALVIEYETETNNGWPPGDGPESGW